MSTVDRVTANLAIIVRTRVETYEGWWQVGLVPGRFGFGFGGFCGFGFGLGCCGGFCFGVFGFGSGPNSWEAGLVHLTTTRSAS